MLLHAFSAMWSFVYTPVEKWRILVFLRVCGVIANSARASATAHITCRYLFWFMPGHIFS